MDNRGNNRSKSRKKESGRIRDPLLKPDVILITKDVMVPVKLPPPCGKLFLGSQNDAKSKFRMAKAQRLGFQRAEENYIEQSLLCREPKKGKKITARKKLGHETIPRSPFNRFSRVNEIQKDIYVKEKEAVSLEKEDLRDRINMKSLKISGAEKPPTISSSRNSISSATTSAETRSFNSSNFDSVEDSLPKLPASIIPSSESEDNISACNPRVESEYCSRISAEINDSNDLSEDIIESNVVERSEDFHLSNTQNYVSNVENLDKRYTESCPNPEFYVTRSKHEFELPVEPQNSIFKQNQDILNDSDAEKLIIDRVMNCSLPVYSGELKDCSLSGQNDREQTGGDKVYAETDPVADERIKIDVEYLLRSLLGELETVEDYKSCINYDGNIDIERNIWEDKENISNKSDYDLDERIPKMIEFRYSSHDVDNCIHTLSEQPNIDLRSSCSSKEFDPINSALTFIKSGEERSQTVYNILDIDSNRSNDQIEVKYSWQIITPRNQGLNDVNVSTEDLQSNVRNENGIEANSKSTDTDDLNLNQLEIRYSWQKLTSKYLAKNRLGNNSLERNQPARSNNDILKNTNDTGSVNGYSSLGENSVRSSNLIETLKKEQGSKSAEDIERIVENSPLNNIISSMLPEMKLFNRRTSFNSTTPDIIGSYKKNHLGSDLNNSSVSSIRHVIANLNEMVTTQRHMFEARAKNNELEKNLNVRKPCRVDNKVEKVEIFPSTLHVLGNYIIRDILPADMSDHRNLIDANNGENLRDYLLSDDSVTPRNTRLDNSVENVLDADLSTKACHSSSRLLAELKEADFLNMLNNFSSKINDSKKDEVPSCNTEENRSSLLLPVLGYDRILTENNWEPEIAEMEEMIGLSQDAARSIDEGKDDGNKAVPYTKNTGPLKPRVQVSFSERKEAGDSQGRKEELLTRLEAAMGRLKQCEQHVDANWNLDYSVLDIEESIADKEVQLPKQVEEHIKDIIKSAEEYLAKLEEQLNDLRNADDQIINSSERTFKDIDETYQLIMDNLCEEINRRRNLVRLETEVFKYEGLTPLRACKQEVDAQIRSTQHLIVLTENMLSHPITFNRERLGKIITATSHMGRIPAVPMPEELPYVTFSPPNDDIKKEITDRISCLGCVLRMGPAQFTEVSERPGGLQLKWHVVDPEYASEEQTFIVQKALGEIDDPTSPAFETVYIGQEASCFVRDLPADQRITLRVGIQVSDTAWSVHRIAQTSIPAYSWDMDNSDYLITNSGRIATKVTQNLTTLLSRSAQFSTNYIIEFKFLEVSSGTDEEGIGLVFEPGGVNDNLKRIGALLITPNGSIFMNGEQKLMQLPKMELGTRIIFTSEAKDDETLRMTIECGNKGVTYDWTVPRPLHFAARFSESNKWNLMVK